MNNYSSAMLKTYSECPQKYFYRYVQNISVPLSAKIFEKGKKIHALASYFLKSEPIEKFEAVLTDAEKKVWNTLKEMPYFKYEPVKVEYTISFKLDKYWFNGRLDALVKNEDGYVILDYKTGSAPKNAQDDFQTMIYLLAADKILKSVSPLKFVYLDLKKNQTVEVVLTDELKKKYETALISTCDKIENSIQLGVFDKNCSGCEYQKLCD